jgi:hypothetical protein
MFKTLRELPNIHRNIEEIFAGKWLHWSNRRELPVPSVFFRSVCIYGHILLYCVCLSVCLCSFQTVTLYSCNVSSLVYTYTCHKHKHINQPLYTNFLDNNFAVIQLRSLLSTFTVSRYQPLPFPTIILYRSPLSAFASSRYQPLPFPATDLFCLVNVFIGRGSLGHGKLF